MKNLKIYVLIIYFLIYAGKPMAAYADTDDEWISNGAKELATEIGIMPALENLRTYSQEYKLFRSKPMPTQIMSLRVEILETLLLTSFEIHTVVGEIDDEIARYASILEVLSESRDRAIRVSNTTNLVSSGAMSVLGSAMQIGTPLRFQNAGNEIEVVAGGVASGLSSYALKEQQGGRRSSGIHPNMLSQLLGYQTDETTMYPPSVWLFLSGSLQKSSDKLSRKEELIQRWIQSRRIPKPQAPSYQHKTALLCGAVPQVHEITIDLLSTRTTMLSDVRTAISLMHNDLYEILKVVHSL